MTVPSDRRLLAMCLLAAGSGFLIWMLAFQDTGGVAMLGIAVIVFAILMLIDGYRSIV